LFGILQAPHAPRRFEDASANCLLTATEILKPGTGDENPILTSRAKLNYSLWTPDGTMFESTIMSGNPASVLLALAVPGWRSHPANAYGEYPRDKLVPADNLVYDIELLEIQQN
jgi:FKBP-type peptidyl-prolyl cis-trans isomerase